MADTAPGLHPMGALMRRFTVDWLDRADPTVPPEIMAPGYAIEIAGVTMAGRDAYVEATSGQLARFPGLTVTVHDAVYTDDGRAALRFTEHGASARGGSAAWRGIGLFRAEGGVLVHNATEEDYLGRRRQLRSGAADRVDPPMVAPWTEPPAEPDPEAEEAVRVWLDAGAPARPGLVHDDGLTPGDLLDRPGVEVDALITAGRRVAVHGVARGTYAGGLPDVSPAGQEVALGVAALVDVAADGTLTGHVVRDRLGAYRALTR